MESGRTFSVFGVLDVAEGRAVHARRGERDKYAPVSRVAGIDVGNGSPVNVARAYVERVGVRALYLADLDAIRGGRPQQNVIGQMAGIGIPLIVDAGVRSPDEGRRVLESGASGVVVGLETLPSSDVLDRIVASLGGDRVAFSLDLKNGVPNLSSPMSASVNRWAIFMDPVAWAKRAVQSGVGALILIDLARVGTSTGIDLDLIGRIRVDVPRVRLFAGGGIENREDLFALAQSGCDGALVATAIHEGRIGRSDLEFVEAQL